MQPVRRPRAVADMVVAVDDQARTHPPRDLVDHRHALRVARRRLMRHQHVGAERAERLDILRPDRHGGERIGHRPALLPGPVGAEGGHVLRQLGARAQARRAGRVPDAAAEGAAEAGDAQPADLRHPCVQHAVARARVARGIDQVGPHLGAAVIVVIAPDPVHLDAGVEQRRGGAVERLVAFHVAEQHRSAWPPRCLGDSFGDEVPAAMDVADEDDVLFPGRALHRRLRSPLPRPAPRPARRSSRAARRAGAHCPRHSRVRRGR